MNCEQAEECLSALCDGRKIPQVAAKHIDTCQRCQLELNEYAAIGAELRRLASLDDAASVAQVHWTLPPVKKTGLVA